MIDSLRRVAACLNGLARLPVYALLLASALVLLAIFRLGYLEFEQRQLTASMRTSADFTCGASTRSGCK